MCLILVKCFECSQMLSCFNVTTTLGLTITEEEEEANIKRQIVLCLREAGGRREGHFRNMETMSC